MHKTDMSNKNRFFLAGVVGWPISHSFSPLMHNYWIKQNKCIGLYLPLAVQPSGLATALSVLKPLGFSGCNVTIPHKQMALKIVDEVDETANTIGAISCITVKKNGSLLGTNNDWYGFVTNLKYKYPGWRADTGPAVVIGAGGASRAVCYGLMHEGVKEIRLVNRTLYSADLLASQLGTSIKPLPWETRHKALEGVTIVVNTTSQGMIGQPALNLSLDHLPKNAIAADIIYTPLETPFLTMAKKRGNPTLNGIGMLLYQGIPAWKQWFNIEPTVSLELRKIMESSLDTSSNFEHVKHT